MADTRCEHCSKPGLWTNRGWVHAHTKQADCLELDLDQARGKTGHPHLHFTPEGSVQIKYEQQSEANKTRT